MKALLIALVLARISHEKSLRIFINDAKIDPMTYLDVNITSTSDQGAHGSTSDEIVLDVRLDNPEASRQTFDAFYLSEKADQECYRTAIALQDWTRKCDFLLTKPNDTYRGITKFTRNVSDSGTKI